MNSPPHGAAVVAGVVGVVSHVIAFVTLQPFQVNVVRYDLARVEQEQLYLPSLLFGVLVLGLPILLAGLAVRAHPLRRGWRSAAALLSPLILTLPLAGFALSDQPPPFFLTFLMVLAPGWAALRAGVPSLPTARPRRAHFIALMSILIFIAVLVIAHTGVQINFFEHFMLGHADFGHFTEELKNALAGRGLRSDSFENTRLGWHFVPLMYLLVPGYAVWPSPKYLMMCGALFGHIAAIPVYFTALRLSKSVLVGWLFALAWLLLPSHSRLIYSNTYGFQWVYAAIPILSLMIAAALAGRWKTSMVLAGLALLVKETVAGAVFGWGLYVALFTRRHKTGLIMVVIAFAYFLLCTTVLIPHFSASGRYERLDLFGELGTTFSELVQSPFTHPAQFFSRPLRSEVCYFVLVLLVPMAMFALPGWRLAAAALPTMALILFMQNDDWLSIKFWHYATVLPLLFFAGLTVLKRGNDGSIKRNRLIAWVCGRSWASTGGVSLNLAVAALICAAWGHYLYGYSPISKAFEVYASTAFLHVPDPRLAVVNRLRREIPIESSVLATERLAVHFVDYRRVYTGRRIQPAQYVLIDRNDHWDTSGLPSRVNEFQQLRGYGLYG
ncbi:MAG: DUF2079 domain-containing protein [Planctomycetes bacterium]|nr:DUF2079 domain-containing protein [Planctomycetota bacterium]